MEEVKFFIITVDVEDWFQVENFKSYIPFETWNQREIRVERNVHRLLDLFDSIKIDAVDFDTKKVNTKPRNKDFEIYNIKSKNKEKKKTRSLSTITPKATFFMLGWLAKKLPHIVREIDSRGHEVASHGYRHDLCYKMVPDKLSDDLKKSKKLLEDLIGFSVKGYRAPSFSIGNEILTKIRDAGYLYDSSYNSFSFNRRYGKISLNGKLKLGISYKISDKFFELPVSNLPVLNKFSSSLYKIKILSKLKDLYFPWSGGAYFRFIPLSMYQTGVSLILKSDHAYLFYMHPWEIDPEQPKVKKAKLNHRLRHYTNLKYTALKLEKLIRKFKGCQFISCSDYLKRRSEEWI